MELRFIAAKLPVARARPLITDLLDNASTLSDLYQLSDELDNPSSPLSHRIDEFILLCKTSEGGGAQTPSGAGERNC